MSSLIWRYCLLLDRFDQERAIIVPSSRTSVETHKSFSEKETDSPQNSLSLAEIYIVKRERERETTKPNFEFRFSSRWPVANTFCSLLFEMKIKCLFIIDFISRNVTFLDGFSAVCWHATVISICSGAPITLGWRVRTFLCQNRIASISLLRRPSNARLTSMTIARRLACSALWKSHWGFSQLKRMPRQTLDEANKYQKCRELTKDWENKKLRTP